MCILIAKPKGVKSPTIEVMKKCWDNNPDGAGVSWSDGDKIVLEKGFMKWDDFKHFYKNLNVDDKNVIFHFRIATHGTVKPENTHPFVVDENTVAAHNGILSGIKNELDLTDSETFFKRICAPILKNYTIKSEEFNYMINACIGTSKLAFIQKSGIYMWGNFIEESGVFYSNDSFKREPFVYTKYHPYQSANNWDESLE